AYTLENDTVAFASQTQILNIQKGVQSIGFGVLQTRIFGQVPFVLTASSSAGLPVLFSAASTLLIIDNNTVTLNGAGTVNIIAYNTGNINYAGTFTSQTLLVSVSETVDTTKRNPTLTFTAIPNLSIGTRYVMTATSNSAAAIVFTSNDERIATVSGNTLTAVSTGTAVITASQEANATYNPATAQQTVTVVSTTTPTIRPLTPIEKGNSAIRIYPNPANDYLTIQYDKTQKVASAKVYDMTGKSYELGIMNYELGLRVDLKTLPKGEYSIILYGEKGEVWKAEKVIKE
ncbi:MAG: T9SS type A sorting domain-containing protein, partial [Chitinophagaceae bacterium]|nr:T9SS type A sorting domain-containing protein [Chitinophagaceae bacterium]